MACTAAAQPTAARPVARTTAESRTAPSGGAARYAADRRDLTADQQVRHALARLTFGARPGDYERVRARGVDRWIDDQLVPERLPDSAAAAFVAHFPALTMSAAELLRRYPPPGAALARSAGADTAGLQRLRRESYRFVGELQAARVGRAVASERQLQEVMVDFWENHFNVFAGKDRLRYHLPEYDAAVRAHALGRFRDLLGAVAHSPAMLVYLDNWRSAADSTQPTLAPRRTPHAAAGLAPPRPARRPRGLNENYARELLELHTLGVDGGYTQRDVVDVARALTGWTVAPRPGRDRDGPPGGGPGGFVFRPALHDAGEKLILGRRFPAGGGEEEGEQVLDLVAAHPSTARLVARKLAVRFVSDTPPPALVARAADAFRRSGGDVRATLAVVLHSPEFFSRAAYRAKVKSPLALVASTARALGVPPDATPRAARLVARLGQPLFGHQAPDGWPEAGAAWVNTGAILARINFGAAVAAGGVPGVRLAAWPAYAALRTAPRAEQIDGVVAALLGGEVSPDTRQVLGRGENPLAPRPPAGAPPPPDPLAQLVGLAIGAPEFQRH